jgi:hypothetical protein
LPRRDTIRKRVFADRSPAAASHPWAIANAACKPQASEADLILRRASMSGLPDIDL